MPKSKFAIIKYENAGEDGTRAIIGDLESVPGLRFYTITGDIGEILVAYSSEFKFKKFRKIAEKIMWKHNDGLYCDVTKRSYESVEHLL
jgi:hypothetical protein